MPKRRIVRGNTADHYTVIITGPHDGSFAVTRRSNRIAVEFRLDNPKAVTALADEVRVAVGALVDASIDWERRAEEQREKARSTVRDAGAKLLQGLVGTGDGRARLAALMKDVRFVEVMNSTSIPWEWLYLGDPEQPCDPTQFLGSNAVLGRSALDPRNHAGPSPGVTELTPEHDRFNQPDFEGLHVRIAEDKTLDSAALGLERAIFARPGVTCELLSELSNGDPTHANAFFGFFNAGQHLSHFNCHASPSGPGVVPKLVVTKGYDVPHTVLCARPKLVPEGTVVFLNCCDGMTVHYDGQASVASEYALRGAGAVVGSTAPIEDMHGYRFAQLFYQRLMRGGTVGRALRDARIQLIKQTNNPVSLAYSMLGAFTTRLGAAA